MGISFILFPFLPNYQLLFANMVFNGIGAGSWDSSYCLWLIELWPSVQTAVIQGNQFMYGVGTIIGPMMMSPFVYGNKSDITIQQRKSSLTIPFSIIGILQIVGN